MANEKAIGGAMQGAAAGTTIMPGWGTAIGGAIGLAGGLMGDRAASEAEDEAKKQLAAYQAYINSIKTSTPEELAYHLQAPELAGTLTPEAEALIQLKSRDAMQDVALDPRLKNTQMQNLQLLQKLGQTGLSPIEAAQLSATQRSVEADQQARIKSMLEQQQARGMGSSDAALTARMIDTQSGANRQAAEAQNTAAMGFQRALSAMTGVGELAGRMESADYQRQANLANALNAREGANVAAQQGREQRRSASGNAANEFNLRNLQNIKNAQADTANEMAKRKAQASEIIFNQQMSKAGLQGPAATGAANMALRTGDRKAQQYADMGTALGQAGYGAWNAFNKSEDEKA